MVALGGAGGLGEDAAVAGRAVAQALGVDPGGQGERPARHLEAAGLDPVVDAVEGQHGAVEPGRPAGQEAGAAVARGVDGDRPRALVERPPGHQTGVGVAGPEREVGRRAGRDRVAGQVLHVVDGQGVVDAGREGRGRQGHRLLVGRRRRGQDGDAARDRVVERVAGAGRVERLAEVDLHLGRRAQGVRRDDRSAATRSTAGPSSIARFS